MRKIFLSLLVLLTVLARAQQKFNNEWIDYAKTYYKFKVGSNGLYRISAATLSAAGLGSAGAEQFQLWRNGVQVPMYTSKSSGSLSASDYLEFWGQMNDGKPDKELYRDPAYHYNDKWSLLTDTAVYFLTVNSAGNNFRLQPTDNNVSGNTLPAEPSFLYKTGVYYRNQINPGLYYLVDKDRLFSSSYDRGEGWTSPDIARNGTLTETLSNLYPATTGPAPTFNIALSGNAYNSRRYKVTINGDSVIGNLLPYMSGTMDQASFNAGTLSSGTASVTIANLTDNCGSATCPVDRMVVHKFELTYSRQFNFGGATNFEFSLPTNNNTSYLEISNFGHSNIAPVLYDLTNGARYVTNLSGSLVQVVLQPSAVPRNLVLVSEATTNLAAISILQPRNFINYNTAATQGDYLIITNSRLFNGANGTNPVEDYRTYRSSAAGGSYQAKIYLEDQLIDQFGFGLKKNAAGIHNFILYVNKTYPVKPKQVFLIGRGVHYLHQRTYEAYPDQTVQDNLERLNLVPTLGYPASDMLLASDLSTSSPVVPIGRLTAITPDEVSVYLKKVKDYEQAQHTPSPSVQDKSWMKNIAHIIGAGDDILDEILFEYMEGYRKKAEDTLYGAKVTTFRKSSTNLVEQLSDADLTKLINNGLSLITYYGHSSATTLEFNLDDPANYNNPGKYPMFFALGCNAGNTFDYNVGRFSSKTYLSDKYVLAPDRGAINFVASTYFGVVHYLDIWNSRAYSNMSLPLYGKSIGEIMAKTVRDIFDFTTTDDFFARCNAEQTVLNGDPAVSFNQQAKPDYVVTDDMISIAPGFVSVADQSFKVKIKMMNLGKAVNRPIVVETKRQYPGGVTEVIRRDTIPGIRYIDSLSFVVGIDPIRDKGSNKIFVTVDSDNAVDELFETNNTGSRDIAIFEEEARPIYPQAFTIVNKPAITLKASTANPFGDLKQYRMEIDTTEKFDSPLKASSSLSSRGGLLEFSPGITFTNNTVYYWRVAAVSNNNALNWNNASFIYINNSSNGYNQSHYYQHAKSDEIGMYLDSTSRTWRYDSVVNNLTMRNGLYGTATTQEGDLTVSVNGSKYIRSACVGFSLIFNVFNPNTFKPTLNTTGQYGSAMPCLPGRQWNYEFSYMTAASRKKIMDFMDSIPAGSLVVVRNIMNTSQVGGYVSDWKSDETLYGAGNSLYQKLKGAGFADLDSFDRARAFSFVYKKGGGFTPTSLFSEGAFDVLNHVVYVKSPDSVGYTVSPVFGPAKAWKQLIWNGKSMEAANTDHPTVNIVGVRLNGTVDTLVRGIDQTKPIFDISFINASLYPSLQLVLRNMDSVNFTPYQLDYWRLTSDPVPEGALAPNVFFSAKDTVDVGEPLDFQIAFKNITDSPFSDSLLARFVVTDRNNVRHNLPVPRFRRLTANDTLNVRFPVATKDLVGLNTLFIDVNPDNAQPEQFHFNNFAYRNFYVRGDTLNPLLDVTFDNVHILNRDIVAAKPDIQIKLKDEAKWMLLNDTSVATVQVRFPGGALKTFRYNSDTLVFVPATGAPSATNTATIRLRPYFTEDGDYELIVTGKDMSHNAAGAMSYRVGFQVMNKPMISNMLNYPNPFTTSTAFVFTVTGAEVPQNIRIQILTVTGKIVREITKEELGPLHIGRNITEFKWDGTDQYGQKLANGVYLYRVITNQNGKSLEKYKSADDNTEKYFNKGYGKMYLMR